jgi:hemerythrin superfamily protein
MDAVTLLRNDHKAVEGLFKKFEKAGPNANKTKQDLVEKIVQELSIHAAIEEQVLYPAAREAAPDATDEVLEALEEHHIVKWVLSELDGMDPTDERFTAKVTVLIENVRHHVEEEEDELFPQLRAAMKRKELEELAQALEQAKKVAPTHPHPRAPDTPPGNVIAGVAAGTVDRAQDTGKKTVRKILGRSRSRERKAG